MVSGSSVPGFRIHAPQCSVPPIQALFLVGSLPSWPSPRLHRLGHVKRIPFGHTPDYVHRWYHAYPSLCVVSCSQLCLLVSVSLPILHCSFSIAAPSWPSVLVLAGPSSLRQLSSMSPSRRLSIHSPAFRFRRPAYSRFAMHQQLRCPAAAGLPAARPAERWRCLQRPGLLSLSAIFPVPIDLSRQDSRSYPACLGHLASRSSFSSSLVPVFRVD